MSYPPAVCHGGNGELSGSFRPADTAAMSPEERVEFDLRHDNHWV